MWNLVPPLPLSSVGNRFRRAIAFHTTALLAITVLIADIARAQVSSQDPNYAVSLLASGLQLPVNMVFRPSFTALLVTEEDGAIKKVDNSGAVSVFATVPADIPPDRGQHKLYGITADQRGNVFAPALVTLPATTPILNFDAQGFLIARLSFPARGIGLTLDSASNLNVISQPLTATGGQAIYKCSPPYQSAPTLFASGFGNLQTIAFNASGQLFGADDFTGIVYEITPGD